MKTMICMLLAITSVQAFGEVRIFIEDFNGTAALKYQCTADETVRAFALDVTVDTGTITGISAFHVGESTAQAKGYGIFPSSFRKTIEIDSETGEVIDWTTPDYTPLADANDCPDGTQLGLDSPGVTLEFGGLWVHDNLDAVPGPTGLLCLLTLSEPANVSVASNICRAGVVLAYPEIKSIRPVVTGAYVDPANRP